MGTFSSSQKVPVYNKNNLSTILAADIGGTNARFQIWLLSSDGLNDVLLTEQVIIIFYFQLTTSSLVGIQVQGFSHI